MTKRRDRDHKTLWSSITIISEDQDDKIFHLDSKGRLIEKFPKHKPRKDLYNKEFLDSLDKADQANQGDQADQVDQVEVTFEDSVIEPSVDPDDFFGLGFGVANNPDQFDFGYFPDFDVPFDLNCPFDFEN